MQTVVWGDDDEEQADNDDDTAYHSASTGDHDDTHDDDVTVVWYWLCPADPCSTNMSSDTSCQFWSNIIMSINIDRNRYSKW